jgi:small Trp-rich protein
LAFLLLGLILLGLKVWGLAPVAAWPWWAIGLPFLSAVLWWQFVDSSGLTQKRQMKKMDQRKQARRDKAMAAMGQDPKGRRSVAEDRADARRASEHMTLGDPHDIAPNKPGKATTPPKPFKQ